MCYSDTIRYFGVTNGAETYTWWHHYNFPKPNLHLCFPFPLLSLSTLPSPPLLNLLPCSGVLRTDMLGSLVLRT